MFHRFRTFFTDGAAGSRESRLGAGLLATVALVLPAVAAANGECGSEVLCVQPVSLSDGTELRAVNQAPFPITVDFDLTPINMRLVANGGEQQVLQPGESATLARLQVSDPARPADYRYRTSWARGDYRVRHDDSYLYQLPYEHGVGYAVSQSYNGEFSHNGDSSYAIDFAMPEGTPIVAAREGLVVGVRADSTVGGPDRRFEDAANYVVIQHADGTFAEYLHLQPHGVRVAVGERVERGQLIGLSGNTGFSGGPHLHFMVSGATADGARRSFPVRFQTAGGIVAQLQTGHSYRNGDLPPQPEGVVGTEGLAVAVDGEASLPEVQQQGPAVTPATSDAPAAGAGDPAADRS